MPPKIKQLTADNGVSVYACDGKMFTTLVAAKMHMAAKSVSDESYYNAKSKDFHGLYNEPDIEYNTATTITEAATVENPTELMKKMLEIADKFKTIPPPKLLVLDSLPPETLKASEESDVSKEGLKHGVLNNIISGPAQTGKSILPFYAPNNGVYVAMEKGKHDDDATTAALIALTKAKNDPYYSQQFMKEYQCNFSSQSNSNSYVDAIEVVSYSMHDKWWFVAGREINSYKKAKEFNDRCLREGYSAQSSTYEAAHYKSLSRTLSVYMNKGNFHLADENEMTHLIVGRNEVGWLVLMEKEKPNSPPNESIDPNPVITDRANRQIRV